MYGRFSIDTYNIYLYKYIKHFNIWRNLAKHPQVAQISAIFKNRFHLAQKFRISKNPLQNFLVSKNVSQNFRIFENQTESNTENSSI